MLECKPYSMEYLTLLFGVLLSLLIIYLFHYLTTLKTTTTTTDLPIPPGKTGWPIIGESIEFLRNFEKGHSEKFILERMTKYSPDVFRTSFLGDQIAVLCGAAGSKLLLTNSNKLVKRWVTTPLRWLVFSVEQEIAFDQYMKPALLSFIKDVGLRNSVGIMNGLIQRHFDTHWHGEVMVYPLAKICNLALQCQLFLSIDDPKVVEEIMHWMDSIVLGLVSLPINVPGTQMNRSFKAANSLKTKILKIVRDQRLLMESCDEDSEKNKTLLSYFLQVSNDDIIVANSILGMFVAGYDPLPSTLYLMFKVMADYPHVYDRVYQENMELVGKKAEGDELKWEDTQELKYTWNVAREVMRLYHSAPLLTREAITDFTYCGYHIPKGFKVVTSIHATHKDPKYFSEPEKFDPSRFEGNGPLPYTYMPFGGGANMCVGKNYAQLIILMFIHNVVKRFKWEVLIPEEKMVINPTPKPAKGFPVLLHSHKSN